MLTALERKLTRLNKPPFSPPSGFSPSCDLFSDSFGSFSCLPLNVNQISIERGWKFNLMLTISHFLDFLRLLLLLVFNRQHGDTASWLLHISKRQKRGKLN